MLKKFNFINQCAYSYSNNNVLIYNIFRNNWITCSIHKRQLHTYLFMFYTLFSNTLILNKNYLILFRQKPIWSTQFRLILNRSVKCFVRSYQDKLLELGSTLVINNNYQFIFYVNIIYIKHYEYYLLYYDTSLDSSCFYVLFMEY